MSKGYQWASTKLMRPPSAASTVLSQVAASATPAPLASAPENAHGTPIWAEGLTLFMAFRYSNALTAYDLAITDVAGQTGPSGTYPFT